MSAYLEQQVWEQREQINELTEKVNVLEKYIRDMNKNEKHDIEEIFIKRKEFNDNMKSLLDWKKWIDTIIEKIKKILPI